jgi:hypothetical protein
MIIARAFELTPGGIKRERDVVRAQPELRDYRHAAHRTGRVEDGLNIALDNNPARDAWLDLWRINMEPLRHDPRFGELVERSGLGRYRADIGRPPHCSREGETITCNQSQTVSFR